MKARAWEKVIENMIINKRIVLWCLHCTRILFNSFKKFFHRKYSYEINAIGILIASLVGNSFAAFIELSR